MQELIGQPFLDKEGQKMPAVKDAKITTVPTAVKTFLDHEHKNHCFRNWWSANLGALRNSPHVDMQADRENAVHGWHHLGHRHPPGPREFFRMHGSHASFVDAVGMDVKMLELIDVDEDVGAFEIKLEVTVSWYDKTFDTLQWNPKSGNMGNNIKVTSYCAPKITIKDVLEGDDGWENHKNVTEVNLCWKEEDDVSPGLQGVVFKTLEMTCKIRDDNPIERLPFDQQELTVEFEMPESASRDTKDHNRYFVPLNVAVEASHDHMTWNNHRAVAHITKPIGEKQHLVCVFRVTRQPWNYIINIMFILFTTAVLSALSFVISLKEVADRSSVTLTLLLTVVAFKLLLADTLPKVSYLTYLDWYTMFCFAVIFFIAFENFAIAFATGIEYTPSCGRVVVEKPKNNSTVTFPEGKQDHRAYLEQIFNQLTRLERKHDEAGEDTTDCKVPTSSGDDSLPKKGSILEIPYLNFKAGSIWYVDAIEHEATFQYYMFGIFVLGHFVFSLVAVKFWYDRKNKCGDAVTRPVQKAVQESFDTFVNEGQQETVTVQAGLNPVVNRCSCVPCASRKRETASLEELEKKMSNEEKQVYSAITNAGLGLTLRNLVSALIDAGLNVQRMKDLNEVLLAQLLGDLQVKPEDRIELMMSARDQVDLMFLQGSASYLFLDLGLAGKLVTKAVCLEKIDDRFSKSKNKEPSALVSIKDAEGETTDHLDHDLKSLANMLYGYLLMNSSATPTMAFLSKRECQSAEGPIYSQLWAGFAAYRAANLADGVDKSKIVVVDLGSGEFKRFLCKLEREKAVERVEEDKDKDTPDQYKKGMQTMFCDLQQHYKDLLDKKTKIVEPGPEVYEEALTEVVNAILGNGNVDAFIAKHGGVDGVYFLATSSTRKFFTAGTSGTGNEAHGANFAKTFILKIISQKLKGKLGGDDTVVEFSLLQQKDEAKFEFNAAKAAIDYAIDIPLQAQRASSFAALAWGNGSCQGYNCGDIEAADASKSSSTRQHQMLSLEVGLGEVTKQIKRHVDTDYEDRDDITGNEHLIQEWWNDNASDTIVYKKKTTGLKDKTGKNADKTSTRIRFRNEDAIDRLRLDVGKELKVLIQQKSTAPIKFFQTVFELKSSVI